MVAGQTSLLSCRKARKARILTSDWEPSGESRVKGRRIAQDLAGGTHVGSRSHQRIRPHRPQYPARLAGIRRTWRNRGWISTVRKLPPNELRVAFAVPGDLATPTGGYSYDRRIVQELRRLGWQVDVADIGRGFPFPSIAERATALAIHRRKQGPLQFLENNPIQSSFWVRFVCPQDKEKLASPSNCKIPSGVQLPPSSRPEAKPHPRPKATAIFARSLVSWHTVNLRSAPSSAIIRTSEHFHVFSPPPRLSVRMFGSGGKKRANASSNCAAL